MVSDCLWLYFHLQLPVEKYRSRWPSCYADTSARRLCTKALSCTNWDLEFRHQLTGMENSEHNKMNLISHQSCILHITCFAETLPKIIFWRNLYNKCAVLILGHSSSFRGWYSIWPHLFLLVCLSFLNPPLSLLLFLFVCLFYPSELTAMAERWDHSRLSWSFCLLNTTHPSIRRFYCLFVSDVKITLSWLLACLFNFC